ncbi:MAG: hypothetical protein HUJ72_07065, partial [Blautia sp.]|nr:hypothetical protein [Blautia sp.]
NNGMYKIKVFYANRENGNVQHEWERLDHIENPTPEELVYLKTKCQTALDIYRAEARNNTLEIETHLSALEIQGIVVAEITA